ncbi:hypothetical protein ABIF66_001702 [Bradyrhizobium japonicum]
MRTTRHGFDISYAMIDLFSSGLAAGILLFFLAIATAKQSGRPIAEGVPNSAAWVDISLDPGDYRPFLLIKTPDGDIYEAWPHRFKLLDGKLIVANAPGTSNGVFELVSQAAWTEPAPDQKHKLLIRINKPKDGKWCFGIMIPEANRRYSAKLASDSEPPLGKLRVLAIGSGKEFDVRLKIGSGTWMETAVDLKAGRFSQDTKLCAFPG